MVWKVGSCDLCLTLQTYKANLGQSRFQKGAKKEMRITNPNPICFVLPSFSSRMGHVPKTFKVIFGENVSEPGDLISEFSIDCNSRNFPM